MILSMQLTCRCLNVVIESRNLKYETFNKPIDHELDNEPFFQQDIAAVGYESMIKKLPALVDTHKCGPWLVHKCMNCEMYTFAYIEETGLTTNTMVLVNKSLLSDPKEISALMESEMFSPVFKVVINHQDVINPAFITEKGHQEINSKLLIWIEEQTALTEEKVQMFMERQYAELEQRKARARRDLLALSKVFSKHKCEIELTAAIIPKADVQEKVSGIKEISKNKNHHRSTTNGTSLDTEGLFDLDDIESCSVGDRSEEECVSDVSEGEEAFQINVRRPRKGHFAQSLPMPVPQFMQDRQQNSSNESPQVPTDIAASIKALARSVHGDTIFGELPRPRFSTHL